MINIKLFEDFEDKKFGDEVREFCESYLSYLLDSDFKLHVLHVFNGRDEIFPYCTVILQAANYVNGFKWSDIKDSFEPFFEFFCKEFDVYGTVNFNIKVRDAHYDQLFNYTLGDTFADDHIIKTISFACRPINI
jgi:hypothetical protein